MKLLNLIQLSTALAANPALATTCRVTSFSRYTGASGHAFLQLNVVQAALDRPKSGSVLIFENSNLAKDILAHAEDIKNEDYYTKDLYFSKTCLWREGTNDFYRIWPIIGTWQDEETELQRLVDNGDHYLNNPLYDQPSEPNAEQPNPDLPY